MDDPTMRWVLDPLGHWEGTPPGCWRMADVIRMSQTVLDEGKVMPRVVRRYWIVRTYFGVEVDEQFDTDEEAMRHADRLWGEYVARRQDAQQPPTEAGG